MMGGAGGQYGGSGNRENNFFHMNPLDGLVFRRPLGISARQLPHYIENRLYGGFSDGLMRFGLQYAVFPHLSAS